MMQLLQISSRNMRMQPSRDQKYQPAVGWEAALRACNHTSSCLIVMISLGHAVHALAGLGGLELHIQNPVHVLSGHPGLACQQPVMRLTMQLQLALT